jgi:hypothetical protein
MTLTGFGFIAIATVGAWVTLSLISRSLQKRQLGRWPVRYRIEHPPFALSVEACDERRRAVQAHLRQYSFDNGLALEFIERPPGTQDAAPRELSSEDPARFWLVSRLRLQLEKDQYLLLERVTDALVWLERLGRITPQQFPYSIRLERLSAREAGENFPWKVVVACDEPEKLFLHLADPAMRNWLGVGVDFISRKPSAKQTSGKRPPEITPTTTAGAFGRCSSGSDGLEGTAGGAIECDGELFGVTCRHVLSSQCGAVVWPNSPVRPVAKEFTQDCPDVAFIRLTDCFNEDGHSSTEIAIPGCQPDLEFAVVRRTRLRKRPQRDSTDGVAVTAAASGFKLGKYFYRGPHFEMTRYFVKRFGISFPLFSRRFSKQGDSGSWIVDEAHRKWLGMIVGGYEPPVTCSVAISAEYINDAFSRYQAAHRSASRSTLCTAKAFV